MSHSGKMLHISVVSRGKACNCVCPDCEGQLIARHCKERSDHFAHASLSECSGESALHKAAKQILEIASKENKRLLIPPLHGIEESEDYCGIPHIKAWEVEQDHILMESAQQEVSLANGQLVADVLVTEPNGATVAVEIHVTNKKGYEEINKYKSINQEAFEINLSTLPWDATEEVIHNAVLEKENRHWLYSHRETSLITSTRNQLDRDIDVINQKYFDRFEAEMKLFRESNNLLVKDLNWPLLEQLKKGVSVYGKSVSKKAEAVPKVTSILGEWENQNGGWKADGIVNGKTKVEVYFLLCGSSNVVEQAKRPSLIVWFNPIASYSDPVFILKWVNIQHWIEELSHRATKKLTSELEELRHKKRREEEYAKYFCLLSDQEKIYNVSARLSIPCPTVTAKPMHSWNCSRPVWKSLIWYYKIKRQQGGAISIKHIAADEWLAKMLGWSDDELLIEKRSKDLWFWFQDLNQFGFLEHTGRQRFSISKKLPKDFVPWQRVYP
ncbi:hypothetical protein F3F96_11800 [Mariprofundus sp. NF]|nr:hypothetical protein [Mariprofundus sp. NF]